MAATSTPYRKRLEGITATPALLSLYDECVQLVKKDETKPLLTSVSTEDSEPTTPKASNDDDKIPLVKPLSIDEARTLFSEFQDKQKKKGKKPKVLPIPVIRSMKVLLDNTTTNNNNDATSLSQQLEDALQDTTQLAFTPKPTPHKTPESPSRRKFRERMERLRLQNEETNYYKLTKNVGTRAAKDDDITTKSMTYAASVGLNMIVAPISFGVFMYFFSGPVLNFMWASYVPPAGGVDIRKVIIGVMSGVGMLFVEMLLFVIRTHEFEKGMRKKQQKKRKGNAGMVQPFGVYSAASAKTYKSE